MRAPRRRGAGASRRSSSRSASGSSANSPTPSASSPWAAAAAAAPLEARDDRRRQVLAARGRGHRHQGSQVARRRRQEEPSAPASSPSPAPRADGKAGIVVGVTDDLTEKYSAVDFVRVASVALGGKGGGGRPDIAQAGGPDAAAIEQALCLRSRTRCGARRRSDETKPRKAGICALRRRVHVRSRRRRVNDRATRLAHRAADHARRRCRSARSFSNPCPNLTGDYGVCFVGDRIFRGRRLHRRISAAPLVRAGAYALFGLPPLTARASPSCDPASAIIDLADDPAALSLILPAADLRVLLLLRLLRFFKLARYSAGIRTLVAVMEAERKALVATAVILLFGACSSPPPPCISPNTRRSRKISARSPPPCGGRSSPSPRSAMATSSPVTLAGRMIASVTMVTGYVMLGLPVGIVATAFAEEIHRREFVVTWSMVAQRAAVSHARRTRTSPKSCAICSAQSVPAGTIDRAARRDRRNRCISSRRAKWRSNCRAKRVRLGVGQFFGEIAMLHKTLRTANVRVARADEASHPRRL